MWGCWFVFFFFSSRRRHTRLQGDWSSDVCSSDLKDLLRGQVSAMQAYPGIARIAWEIQVPVGPNALRHGEALLSLLIAGGLTLPKAAYAGDALSLYTKAFAYEASVWTTVDTQDVAARGRRMAADLSSVPAGTFVHMPRIGDLFGPHTAADRFEFGLTTFLNGLRTR